MSVSMCVSVSFSASIVVVCGRDGEWPYADGVILAKTGQFIQVSIIANTTYCTRMLPTIVHVLTFLHIKRRYRIIIVIYMQYQMLTHTLPIILLVIAYTVAELFDSIG